MRCSACCDQAIKTFIDAPTRPARARVARAIGAMLATGRFGNPIGVSLCYSSGHKQYPDKQRNRNNWFYLHWVTTTALALGAGAPPRSPTSKSSKARSVCADVASSWYMSAPPLPEVMFASGAEVRTVTLFLLSTIVAGLPLTSQRSVSPAFHVVEDSKMSDPCNEPPLHRLIVDVRPLPRFFWAMQ